MLIYSSYIQYQKFYELLNLHSNWSFSESFSYSENGYGKVALLCLIFVSKAEASLIAYWGFDEGTGTTANDSSPNGYDGTVYRTYRTDIVHFNQDTV